MNSWNNYTLRWDFGSPFAQDARFFTFWKPEFFSINLNFLEWRSSHPYPTVTAAREASSCQTQGCDTCARKLNCRVAFRGLLCDCWVWNLTRFFVFVVVFVSTSTTMAVSPSPLLASLWINKQKYKPLFCSCCCLLNFHFHARDQGCSSGGFSLRWCWKFCVLQARNGTVQPWPCANQPPCLL